MRSSMRLAALLTVTLCAASVMPADALAADPACAGFSWNVSRERALFAGTATSLPAGADSGSAPPLTPGRLYALRLQPAAKVSFVTAPGKRTPIDGGYAGLAALRIPAPGIYRIAVNAPLWIDVVADGGLMSVKDFQGAHDCDAPRKILEFEFRVPRQVMLQFSSATDGEVRIAITAAGP
jgi:hypothetical protein